MPQADLGHELLEAEPPVTRSPRPAEVLVDHDDRLRRPAQLDGALAQRILPRRRAADSTLRSTCASVD
jgi:hypothetical protein